MKRTQQLYIFYMNKKFPLFCRKVYNLEILLEDLDSLYRIINMDSIFIGKGAVSLRDFSLESYAHLPVCGANKWQVQ